MTEKTSDIYRDIESQFRPMANEYSILDSDPELSRYEHSVNWPSLHAMLPPSPAKILDYGCGSGFYTRQLLREGYDVMGVDAAPEMIQFLDDIPEHAQVWTYHDPPLAEKYDAVIAKLVAQFVEDLDGFAEAMRRQLKPDGVLVISIPRQERIGEVMVNGQKRFLERVGSSGLYVVSIHREVAEYEKTFAKTGILLTKVEEPVDPYMPDRPKKRLNMLFRAT